jgi:DNA-directed RNA polymerase specialized sigma24 family protein
MASAQTTAPPGEAWFTTTHWSVIFAAAQNSAPGAQEALEKLCRTYWYPLYVYVRRRGQSAEDAKDLVQGFFARLLAKSFLEGVVPEKGKFRSFLLAALNHFLSDEWDKARAQKRGGGLTMLSLDETVGEERYRLEPAETVTAEKLFERRWALTLLEQARLRLKEESTQLGQGELYERFRALEAKDANSPSYAQIATDLGSSESAVKSALFRMRQRYKELVREEVGSTVASPSEIDEEIRYLISVLSA